MKYYIYIIYSELLSKYYVGYSNDISKRLLQHNTSKTNTYTSKGRPWVIVSVFLTPSKTIAISLERFIKDQHSKKLLLQLIDDCFVPFGKLAQLVRVPYLRD